MSQRWWFACAIAVGLTMSSSAVAEKDNMFRHSFAGSNLPRSKFQYVGKTAERYVMPGGDGLRITLPASKRKQPFPQVGVTPKFPIAGDFEITLRYQIYTLQPTFKGDPGCSIFVRTESPTKEAASLSLVRNLDKGFQYATKRFTGEQGNRKLLLQHFPADEKTDLIGQLRLTRKGKMLSYSVASGTSDSFTQLRELELGDEPLAEMGLLVDPSTGNDNVDVVFKELVVKADSLSPGGEAGEGNESTSWVPWIVGGGIVVVLLALTAVAGAFLFHRRGSRRARRA